MWKVESGAVPDLTLIRKVRTTAQPVIRHGAINAAETTHVGCTVESYFMIINSGIYRSKTGTFITKHVQSRRSMKLTARVFDDALDSVFHIHISASLSCSQSIVRRQIANTSESVFRSDSFSDRPEVFSFTAEPFCHPDSCLQLRDGPAAPRQKYI